MPTLTIIAGPNGAGKSTITRLVEIEGLDHLLDPDAIARRIHPQNPSLAAIAAGREVLRRQAEYFRCGESFAVETTLAGSRVNIAGDARSYGFRVHLLYVGVNTPERSIARVRDRVAKGGHFVPDEDVRRRYVRSMENARAIWPQVDKALLFDNSDAGHRLVLIAENGRITFRVPDLPAWLATWAI